MSPRSLPRSGVLRIGALLLAIFLVVGIAASIWLDRLRSGPGLPTGSRTLAGLEAPVEVLWDSLAVPHVFARTLPDAYRAQGWLHATHRLWQIDMFRRVATGRLSEVFGEVTLASDRFLRTLGMDRAAARSEATLDPATRRLVEAYVEGLNQAIEAWQGPWPPEFVILGARPEPFTVRDALALEKVMAWDLADYARTLDLAEACRMLGPEDWERIRPRYPSDGTTIQEDTDHASAPAAVAGRESFGRPSGVAPERETIAAARIPEPARSLLAAGSVVRASNAWVVGGMRSASGKPLLANDMHLLLNAPPVWYLIGLHAPDLDVVGMSLPGTPGVIAGHTAGVAWGFTNAYLDDTDLFLERVDPSDTTRYLTPAGSTPFDVRVERIVVKGRSDPESLIVRETRHGPVITAVESRAGGELMALRWIALDASTTHRALRAMNRAGSVDEFLAGLAEFDDPHQNVVFADTAGAWGYWMAGRVPLRPDSVPPLLPVPGWTGAHDWQGTLPFEEHPHALRPSVGFIATANNRQTRDPVSRMISDEGWALPYRAERITERLADGDPLDAESLAALQLDVTSTFARRALPLAVAAFRQAGLDSVATALAVWDGQATMASHEAALFYTWVAQTRAELRRSLYGNDRGYVPMAAVERALREGSLPPASAATAARAAQTAARNATWGSVHRLVLDHPLASSAWLHRLFGFGRRDLPREGGPYTVNVADFTGSQPPFTVTHGPSQRHVVDLADPDGAGGFILPGGQSGFPGDPHFMDQLPRWRKGELIPLPLDRARVEARTVARLRLRPPS